MQLKLFILPVKDLSAAETELNAFQRLHRVLAVAQAFVNDGENSFWIQPPGTQRTQSNAAFSLGSWWFNEIPAWQRFGVVARRLEPCASGRQLEQQREQLPGGEPQPQQPDQPEQQPRVPFRLARSSTRPPDGGGADPATLPSCRPLAGGQIDQSRPVLVARMDFCANPPGGAPPAERRGEYVLDLTTAQPALTQSRRAARSRAEKQTYLRSSALQSIRIFAGREDFGARLCEPQHCRTRIGLLKLQSAQSLRGGCGSQSRAPFWLRLRRAAKLCASALNPRNRRANRDLAVPCRGHQETRRLSQTTAHSR